ncbi:hypothetical protein Salat_1142100 [Sesamum alatum]|uniref:Uncharacterized protein n=1 Tax=Sesamum alatum TaxID=300844 RepID=A0AAE1YDU0_9LAMI|nr:hypothetical protein Salat_1142100 [Sesamum alatum]
MQGHFLDVVGRMGLANSVKDVFKRELDCGPQSVPWHQFSKQRRLHLASLIGAPDLTSGVSASGSGFEIQTPINPTCANTPTPYLSGCFMLEMRKIKGRVTEDECTWVINHFKDMMNLFIDIEQGERIHNVKIISDTRMWCLIVDALSEKFSRMGEQCQKIYVHDVKERAGSLTLLNLWRATSLMLLAKRVWLTRPKMCSSVNSTAVHHQFHGIGFQNNVAFILPVQLEDLTSLVMWKIKGRVSEDEYTWATHHFKYAMKLFIDMEQGKRIHYVKRIGVSLCLAFIN